MKTERRALLAIVLLSACGGAASAEPTTPATETTDVRAEITEAYARYAHACATHDLPGVMAMLTDDVEWRPLTGEILHRAEIEPGMGAFLQSIPEGASVFFTIDELTPDSPDVVTARVVFHLEADVADAAAPGGTRHATMATGWLDTWRRGPDGWQNVLGIEQQLP